MDLRLWLWVVFLLLAARTILIWSNVAGFAEEVGFPDYLEVFLAGFRFDVRVATVVIIPSLLLSCLCGSFRWEKVAMVVRGWTFGLFTAFWVIVTTLTLGYFKQFHNQFDANVLGLVHDDFGAIVQTVWKGYPVIRGLLVMGVVVAGLLWLGRRWLRRTFGFGALRGPGTGVGRMGVALVVLCLLLLGLRGSWGSRPMQMKDAARTEDFLLNRCVVNSFTAFIYAVKAHGKLMEANGLDSYLGKESITAACEEFAGRDGLASVDDVFLRTAKGRPGEKPRHIFLILMESYDGWTMLDEHASWNISNEMKALGREGIYVQRFLSGSRSTMTSMASVIGGMADAGIITNERSRPGEGPYGTAIAEQMKKLGYETHLYYAGYGGWERVDDFSREQGFEHTHLGPSMEDGGDTNEWGVTDKALFSYMAKNFVTGKPTFNLVLSSSNHPPYSVDLEAEGCPLKEVPEKYREGFEGGDASLKMLGHHWYSDHEVGKFVREASAKEEGCLFAITGDHWGRAFPGPRPTLLEQALVPLVLYGPGILPEDWDAGAMCGSHYDLGATLIELAAEAGQEYRAMGRNILETREEDVAVSRLWLLGSDFVVPADGSSGVQDLSGKSIEEPGRLSAAQRRYDLMHGISWWRIGQGNELPKE